MPVGCGSPGRLDVWRGEAGRTLRECNRQQEGGVGREAGSRQGEKREGGREEGAGAGTGGWLLLLQGGAGHRPVLQLLSHCVRTTLHTGNCTLSTLHSQCTAHFQLFTASHCILANTHWTLDTGHWTLDTGHRTPDTGHRTPCLDDICYGHVCHGEQDTHGGNHGLGE